MMTIWVGDIYIIETYIGRVEACVEEVYRKRIIWFHKLDINTL